MFLIYEPRFKVTFNALSMIFISKCRFFHCVMDKLYFLFIPGTPVGPLGVTGRAAFKP